MNIGIVTTWLERGAAYVSRAYLETLSVKHKVFIYARGGEKYAIDDPVWDQDYVTWGKVTKNKLYTYVDWEDFRKWILENQIEIVIFNEQRSWGIILRCKKELNLTIGSYIDYYTPDTVPFFKIFDFVLCNTKRHYNLFKQLDHALYIPWGTDTDLFSYTPRKKENDEIVFFHSCGMSPYRKGTDLVLYAFRKISGKARLILHTQVDLDLYTFIKPELKADPRITVIQKDAGPPGYYHLGDVYIYPSRVDGIGLTVAEALASGLPVITTNSPPMNEFVQNGINGRLVEVASSQIRSDHYYWPESVCNLDSLTEAMQSYIDNSEKINEYRQQARFYAVQNLNWCKNSLTLPDDLLILTTRPKLIDSQLYKQIKRYENRNKLHLQKQLIDNKVQNGLRKIKALLIRLQELGNE